MIHLRICICEDDAGWREACKRALTAFGRQHGEDFTFSEYASGEQLLFAAEDIAASLDILFMDIHLPGADGFETVRRMRQYNFAGEVIFLTVSGEHYADAFDLRAFNYIEKSAFAARLPKVLAEALQVVREKGEEMISIMCAGITKSIALSSISYFEVNHSIISVHYGDGRALEFYSTLDKIEERLFGRNFIRVHRAFIVNASKIREVRYCEITMADGTIISVSRSRMDEVREACRA